MPRQGITKADVAKARSKLMAAGRHPSIDAVRSALGDTGSRGTILRHLKDLNEEETPGGAEASVSEAIQTLVTKLAERLKEEADAQLVAQAEEFERELADASEAAEASRNEAEALRTRLAGLSAELAAEKAEHAKAIAALHEERIALAKLTQRLADIEAQFTLARAHSAALEENCRLAQRALEDFRDGVSLERERDRRQLDLQQAEIQSLCSAREQLAVAEVKQQQLLEQLNSLQQEKQKQDYLLTEGAESNRKLQADLAAAQAVIGSLERTLQALMPAHVSTNAKG